MNKVGVIGNFAMYKASYDGQTIKTKILYDELIKNIGKESVESVDVFNWEKNILKVLYMSISIMYKCDNVVIILSNKGRNVFIPLLYIFKMLFNTKLHCMVLGGGFAKQMECNRIVKNISKKIDGIYIETSSMLRDLEVMGYRNLYLLNNFKRLNILNLNDINNNITYPLKLCTFSRVCKEKGIEDIVKAIIEINNRENNVIYTLDIYGQVEKGYEEEFYDFIRLSPKYIKYKGVIEFHKSVEVIKKYFMLVFPTLYRTEGIPGTIIDAYSAGVPVISAEWDSYKDVVDDRITGITYELGNINKLIEILDIIRKNPIEMIKLKENCINKAHEYSAEVVIKDFLSIMKVT